MRGIVIIFILSMIFTPALAQDSIPRCTQEQAAITIRLLDDAHFAGNLIALKASASVEDLLNNLMILRNAYLFDVAPDLPNCYEVHRFNLAAGMYIYNMALEASLLRLDDADLLIGIEDRTAAIDEYIVEAQAWLDDIVGLSEIQNDALSGSEVSSNVQLSAVTAVPNNREPANCGEARAMGLTAAQAGQYSHLDRDGDGTACYGD